MCFPELGVPRTEFGSNDHRENASGKTHPTLPYFLVNVVTTFVGCVTVLGKIMVPNIMNVRNIKKTKLLVMFRNRLKSHVFLLAIVLALQPRPPQDDLVPGRFGTTSFCGALLQAT